MESLQKSGENQGLQKKTYGRLSLISVNENEKQLLQSVKSIDDLFLIKAQFATITSLKIESKELADAFIVSNFQYVFHVLNIELNDAQRNDLLDEIGQVGWLTMADIKLFLDRMKKHKFFRRDYQELLVEFWKYADERLERAFEIEASKEDKTDNFERSKGVNSVSIAMLNAIKQIKEQ